MNIPVFDLHCDTVLTLLHSGRGKNGGLYRNKGHIDLERAKNLKGYAQCFACFTTTQQKCPDGKTVEDLFQEEFSLMKQELHHNSHTIRQAFSAQDVSDNYANGFMSGILTIEGPAGFGFDPGKLEALYDSGFRITTLGWNEKNPLTGSHLTGGGLTDLGMEYVKEAQRLGMIIDVSHISDEGFWDIIEHTQAPIIASHSNSRAVHPVSRNLSDDMFRAICGTGGVAGFNQYTEFIGTNPSVNDTGKHILHFLELDPDGKHIALGGDLDGCDTLPAGFAGVEDYPKLADVLLHLGIDENILYNIFWNNALGVMKRCCM